MKNLTSLITSHTWESYSIKGVWSKAVNCRKLLFAKVIGALINFARKLGKHPIDDLLVIYKAKCVSVALYGAGIWGHVNVESLQQVENGFLKYLLAVPNSTATYTCHAELGLPYLSDLIKIQPILLWHRVWTGATTGLNPDVIKDCLNLHQAKRIPWLAYIKNFMQDLDHSAFFDNPETLSCLTRRESIRLSSNIMKPSVRTNQLLLTKAGIQPYLLFTHGNYDRLLLTRLRLGNFHNLVTFPQPNDWSHFLCPCPCDDTAVQSTIHIIFFCKFYILFRKMWILPHLKLQGLRLCRPAFIKLLFLDDEIVTDHIAKYLKGVVRIRKTMQGPT